MQTPSTVPPFGCDTAPVGVTVVNAESCVVFRINDVVLPDADRLSIWKIMMRKL